MSETSVTPDDIAALGVLANGIIPADERDAGAATVQAGSVLAARIRKGVNGPAYAGGLRTASDLARAEFDCAIADLNAAQVHRLLGLLAETEPRFFRLLRADVCALYLGDAEVWRRIGFPGPSSDAGGYPDFDRPQR